MLDCVRRVGRQNGIMVVIKRSTNLKGGYGEYDWARVRMDLIEEIQKNMDLYNVLYPEYNYVNTILHSLIWFQHTAPEAY